MKIEVLYFEGCPNHAPAIEMVRRVVTRQKVDAQVVPVEVRDNEIATKLRFIGSPSIRVNGEDIEPCRQDDPPFYGCRTYTVQGKTGGVPPEAWLSEAVRAASHI